MEYIKVLYVDSNYEDFLHIKSLLEQKNSGYSYESTWCNDYKIAINSMLKHHYDIYVVSDDLGKWPGLELLHEAVCSNCNEPIIMLSAENKIYTDALKKGAADCLAKENLSAASLDTSIRYAIEHSTTIKKLKTDSARFRNIFERCKEPIIVSNKEGVISDFNKAALEFFNTFPEDLLKANTKDFFAEYDDVEKFKIAMESEGSVTDFVTFLKAGKSDELRYCSISSFVQITQRGNNELYYSIIHDLTKRRNEVIEILARQKKEVSKKLAMTLAQKIQNPLSTVNFALHEMSENIGNDAADLKVYIDIVKENCGRISQLTAGILSETILPTE